MSAKRTGPITLLIAALGGEGGGVLSDWILDAAATAGFPAQSTSIPGVSQRTGATTYYLEVYPEPAENLSGRPVFALTPSPGDVDVMVASELIEAGRAMQNGYVSPDRTTLIASTHRIYAIGEKGAMGDGRYDADRVIEAGKALAKRVVLIDMAALARKNNTVISAVLFGAVAGSGALPLAREACEAAIAKSGKGVEASLRGFAAAFATATGEMETPTEETTAAAVPEVARVRRSFPPETHGVLEAGVQRLIDYQDAAYAKTYLDRLEPILALDAGAGRRLVNETGRYLALWMSYEDVIRVADLKTRESRFQRVRREVGARPGQLLGVVEFLKPGLDEFCSVLPGFLARPVRGFAQRLGLENRLNIGLKIKTTSVSGFLVLKWVSSLRRWRRFGARFAEEQTMIERWLVAIKRAAANDPELALEVAECARLVKGYGETHRRGRGNFVAILENLVETDARFSDRKGAIRAARDAALRDPDGGALRSLLAEIRAGGLAASAAGAPSVAAAAHV